MHKTLGLIPKHQESKGKEERLTGQKPRGEELWTQQSNWESIVDQPLLTPGELRSWKHVAHLSRMCTAVEHGTRQGCSFLPPLPK